MTAGPPGPPPPNLPDDHKVPASGTTLSGTGSISPARKSALPLGLALPRLTDARSGSVPARPVRAPSRVAPLPERHVSAPRGEGVHPELTEAERAGVPSVSEGRVMPSGSAKIPAGEF